MSSDRVRSALLAAWHREIEAAQCYRAVAEVEPDERRKRILLRLAECEEDHAARFAARVGALGGEVPTGERASTEPTGPQKLLARTLGTDAMLRRLEAEEQRNADMFGEHAENLREDAESHRLFLTIEEEEKEHGAELHQLKRRETPRTRLEAMLKGEKWHVSTGSWIGDAIYGINDGLGSVFGVVSGMAGAANTASRAAGTGDRIVLVAGLVATLASALSMGSSAFMAAKAEREVYDAELRRERAEIEDDPDHEKEELSLIFQAKGFSEEEAHGMALRIADQPELFLKTMAQEELGLSERSFPNPVTGAVSAMVSTAVGGILPVIPFFFLRGMPAVWAAAGIGMAAHFAVGAAKSLITARRWWTSGLEMTVIAVITGSITYGLGRLFHIG